MKCWVHPEVDAIGVCKSCGKGVCRECSVTIRDETYCKACVETGKVYPRAPAPTPPTVGRSGLITAASVLFFIIGAIEVVGGLIIAGAGAVVGTLDLPYLGADGLGLLIGVIGVVVLIVGAVEIVAGKLLLDNKKSGGILGMILAIIGLVLSLITIPVGIIGALINLILIILIAVGWNTLQD